MSAIIIDGKAYASDLRERIKEHVDRLKSEHNITAGLAVIIVGHDPASQVYVRNKAKQTLEVGMNSFKYDLPECVAEQELLTLINDLNERDDVHGILVQMPVPEHINATNIINALNPDKDVDMFHPLNAGKLMTGQIGPVSCTPLGCLMMLRDVHGLLEGKNAVVIGRSNLVGKPMAQLLLKENCTVTMAHSHTKNLPDIVRQADIVIAAVGRAKMVQGDWIKPGATVIDVGINRIDAPEKGEGKTRLVGDVDFEVVRKIAGYITPVPGGVGPMTIACLLANTITTTCLINNITPPEDLTA